MNTNRLQKLFDSYIEKYELFHDAEGHELYKWAALSHFQKYWDLDAENFGEMVKASFEEGENQIDGSHSKPVGGIVYLCAQGEEIQEKIRSLFRALFAPDNSDYQIRQKKAESFVEEMNKLLKETAPDQWKYHQSMRSAILFLSFADPGDNYMYREFEAKAFAEYVEFEQDILVNDRLDLPLYYEMCDELVAQLQQQTELCQMVADDLASMTDGDQESAGVDIDDDYHILAYDIIHCAHAYELYDDIPFREEKKDEDLDEEGKQKEIKQLKKQIAGFKRKNTRLQKELDKLALPEMTGHRVFHTKYGEGTVAEQRDQYLTVEFAAARKKFVLPDAFSKGFLKTDGEETLICEKISALRAEKEKLERDLSLVEVQLKSILEQA